MGSFVWHLCEACLLQFGGQHPPPTPFSALCCLKSQPARRWQGNRWLNFILLSQAFNIGAPLAPGPSLSPLLSLSPQQCLCSWAFQMLSQLTPTLPAPSWISLTFRHTASGPAHWTRARMPGSKTLICKVEAGVYACTLPLCPQPRVGSGKHCALTPWRFLCFVSKLSNSSDPFKALCSPWLSCFIFSSVPAIQAFP